MAAQWDSNSGLYSREDNTRPSTNRSAKGDQEQFLYAGTLTSFPCKTSSPECAVGVWIYFSLPRNQNTRQPLHFCLPRQSLNLLIFRVTQQSFYLDLNLLTLSTSKNEIQRPSPCSCACTSSPYCCPV